MTTENPYRSSEVEQPKPKRPTRNAILFLVIVFLFFFGLFLVGVLNWTTADGNIVPFDGADMFQVTRVRTDK